NHMRRSIIILIGVVVLVAALSAGIFLALRSRNAGQNANQNTEQTNTPFVTNTSVTVAPDPERDAIIARAVNFTERYGSSSTDTGTANLSDVLPWMTARFRAETERDIAT